MPVPVNLTIVGELQGAIEGSCEIEGREGSVLVYGLDHTVEIPTDSRGATAGRRVHRPVSVIKEVDKSSPMLYQALCTNERLTEVRIDWYRVDETGVEELYFTTFMVNAFVASIRPWIPNAMERDNEGLRHMETVSFTYEKIRWTWEPDGIEYEDAWGEAVE